MPTSTEPAQAMLLSIADAAGSTLYASPQLLRLTGLSLPQLSTEWLTLVHADDQDRVAATVLARVPEGRVEAGLTQGCLDLPEPGVSPPLASISRGLGFGSA